MKITYSKIITQTALVLFLRLCWFKPSIFQVIKVISEGGLVEHCKCLCDKGLDTCFGKGKATGGTAAN